MTRRPPRNLVAGVAALVSLIACAGTESTAPKIDAWAAVAFGDDVAWSVSDTSAWRALLALDDGNVFVLNALVQALDPSSGQARWSSVAPSDFRSLALAGSFIGGLTQRDGLLRTYDRSTGVPGRSNSPTSLTYLQRVSTDGTMFYGPANGHAVAVNPVTGAVVWDVNLATGNSSGSTHGLGVTAGDHAVAVTLNYAPPTFSGMRDSAIVALLDPATGMLRWRVAIPDSIQYPSIYADPVIAAGAVIVTTGDHQIYALDLNTGAITWQVSAKFSPDLYGTDGLAACNGIVVTPDNVGGLVALDASSGALRWRIDDLDQASLFKVLCSFGTVVTLAFGGPIRVIDATTGAIRASYPLGTQARDCCVSIFDGVRDASWLYFATTLGIAKVRAP